LGGQQIGELMTIRIVGNFVAGESRQKVAEKRA
jgi:hypothetical protein